MSKKTPVFQSYVMLGIGITLLIFLIVFLFKILVIGFVLGIALFILHKIKGAIFKRPEQKSRVIESNDYRKH